MPLRKVAAVAMAVVVMAVVVMAAGATMEVATEVEGIFRVAAMAGGISAVGISVAAGATSVADRLRGRVFAAIVLSQFITADQTQCGR